MNYNVAVMSRNYKTFGQWLKSHRQQLDLYQSHVAKKAGVSTSYVSNIERTQPHTVTGRPIHPERDKVIALAQAVEGNVDEALLLAGYAPVSEPDQLQILSFEGLDERDIWEINELIALKRRRKGLS